MANSGALPIFSQIQPRLNFNIGAATGGHEGQAPILAEIRRGFAVNCPENFRGWGGWVRIIATESKYGR